MKTNKTLRLVLGTILATTCATAAAVNLPLRDAPIPRTTTDVPHIQIGVEPVPDISAELLQRVAEMPGIEIRDTVISLPGALGFWITDDVNIARPQVIIRGREFAHVHPDGSLHASLPPAIAEQAVRAGWAVPHPWAGQRPGWEGFVMLYTPTTTDELEVVLALVRESFIYVTRS